jgi:hypothetical protein
MVRLSINSTSETTDGLKLLHDTLVRVDILDSVLCFGVPFPVSQNPNRGDGRQHKRYWANPAPVVTRFVIVLSNAFIFFMSFSAAV